MSVITLRLAADLKRRLQALASARGESLNHFLESVAVQALVAEETARRVWARRESGSGTRALAVLDRVPARKPVAGDALPAKGRPRSKGRPGRKSR
jgi:predicted transcriptional regulator